MARVAGLGVHRARGDLAGGLLRREALAGRAAVDHVRQKSVPLNTLLI